VKGNEKLGIEWIQNSHFINVREKWIQAEK